MKNKNLTSLLLLASVVACGGSETASESGANATGSDVDVSGSPAAQSAPPTPPPERSQQTISVSCPESELDIVGLCLGLTVAEAESVLQAHDESIQIESQSSYFTYSNGDSQQQTEPAVARLDGRIRSTGEHVWVEFTAPPDEPRAVAIYRTVNNNLPAPSVFKDALIAKYGEPSERAMDPYQPSEWMRWEYPNGREYCVLTRNTGTGFGSIDVPEAGSDIAYQLGQQGFENPDDCAKVLQVRVGGTSDDAPVDSVDFRMTDLAFAAAAEERTFAWIEDLEAAARAARLENADVPNL
jgi:hypothetical protein